MHAENKLGSNGTETMTKLILQGTTSNDVTQAHLITRKCNCMPSLYKTKNSYLRKQQQFRRKVTILIELL